jgi:hypothetical protein
LLGGGPKLGFKIKGGTIRLFLTVSLCHDGRRLCAGKWAEARRQLMVEGVKPRGATPLYGVERCKIPGGTPGTLAGGTPALRRVRVKPLTG